MPTPKNAPYKLLQRSGSRHYPRSISFSMWYKRRGGPQQTREGRKVYEQDSRGCIINVTAERRIRKQLDLSPRQYRKQKQAARRVAKMRGVVL